VIIPAIYELLNVPAVTNLVQGIYSAQAPQAEAFPIIILNESRDFERFKRGSKITFFSLQLDIYADKGEEGNAGLKQCAEIEKEIIKILDYYSGTVAGIGIDTILHEDSENFYDVISKKARVMMTFNIRVNKEGVVTVCPNATVTNSDLSYTATVASGGTLVLPDTEYIFTVAGVPQAPLFLPTLKNETINIVWQ
jgi:hypothetical protein